MRRRYKVIAQREYTGWSTAREAATGMHAEHVLLTVISITDYRQPLTDSA